MTEEDINSLVMIQMLGEFKTMEDDSSNSYVLKGLRWDGIILGVLTFVQKAFTQQPCNLLQY